NRSGSTGQNANRILAMLADPKRRETAVKMLRVEPVSDRVALLNALDTEPGRKMLEVLKGNVNMAATLAARFPTTDRALKCAEIIMDPKNDGAKWFLTADLSEEITKSLVPMLMDPETVEIGQKFLERLGNRRTQFDAYNVLKLNLPGNESKLMWELYQKNRPAFDMIAGVVESNFNGGARAWLKMMADPKQQGKVDKVLEMLKNPEEQATAVDLLKACDNSEQIELVLKTLGNAKLKDGMKKLLSVAAKTAGSDIENERPAAQVLISFLALEKSGKGTAHQVLNLLNDPKTSECAMKSLTTGRSIQDFHAFVSMTTPTDNSEESRRKVEAVIELGNSKNPADRKAFENLLQMAALAKGLVVDGPARSRRFEEEPRLDVKSEEAYEKVLAMLTNPAEKDSALALLRNASDGRGCAAFLTMAGEPDTADGVESIIKMLTSNDAQKYATAKTFLSLFSDIRADNALPVSAANVKALVQALSKPETKEQAMQAVLRCRSREQMDKIGELYRTEKGRTLVEPLLKYSQDQPDRALELLRLDSLAQIETMLKLLEDPATAENAVTILSMQQSENIDESSAASQLIRLLSDGGLR
ncbi:MAG: hypothetical protein K2Z81_19445, partial [Cyanobacteria bacterium]|nr:hypothetical protein [Cyanobacteriota bacterium]